MKTIEQKAKAYDEAIDKIADVVEAGTIEQGLAEFLFPELKESEGMKTKRMLDIITYKMSQHQPDIFTGEENEWFNAWLEKQDEQKSANKKEEVDNLHNYLYGEQKPAWSEEDEETYYGVIETEQYMLDVVNGIKKFDVGNISIKEECTKELNWLKSLKDRVQPKQEWREKDSPHYDDICEILINLLHSKTSNVNKDAVQKDLDWLISLEDRYTWKPSEEQMKALWEVYKGGKEQASLATLYSDLKKLRKE